LKFNRVVKIGNLRILLRPAKLFLQFAVIHFNQRRAAGRQNHLSADLMCVTLISETAWSAQNVTA
jgi:hypothetical protein